MVGELDRRVGESMLTGDWVCVSEYWSHSRKPFRNWFTRRLAVKQPLFGVSLYPTTTYLNYVSHVGHQPVHADFRQHDQSATNVFSYFQVLIISQEKQTLQSIRVIDHCQWDNRQTKDESMTRSLIRESDCPISQKEISMHPWCYKQARL